MTFCVRFHTLLSIKNDRQWKLNDDIALHTTLTLTDNVGQSYLKLGIRGLSYFSCLFLSFNCKLKFSNWLMLTSVYLQPLPYLPFIVFTLCSLHIVLPQTMTLYKYMLIFHHSKSNRRLLGHCLICEGAFRHSPLLLMCYFYYI